MTRSLRIALLVVGVALALTACGRRGALEPPPDASAKREEAQPQQGPAPASPIGRPAGRRPAPIKPGTVAFPLDFLL